MAARRFCISVVLSSVVVVVLASPASAGGSHLDPVKDRYETGEAATLVGYIGPGQLGWVEDGPFYAYLVPGPDETLGGTPLAPPSGTALGPLTVEETGAGGYLALRISITFTIPSDLAPGPYAVTYCNASCDQGIGDLIGGYVYVGADPPSPITRTWALDEPEIVNLADDALLSGPGFQLSAAQIHADRRPPWSSEFYAFGGTSTTLPEASAASVAPPLRSQGTAAASRANDDGGVTWIVRSVLVSALTAVVLFGVCLALRSRRVRARMTLEETSLDVEPEPEPH
jgi:hypothetical protein